MARRRDAIQDAKCCRQVVGQQIWDNVTNKRENFLGEEESNDFKQNKKKEGQGVADLWEDNFEDTPVNAFIWFLELRTESQCVQEIASFTGTYKRQPDRSVLSLSSRGNFYTTPSSP